MSKECKTEKDVKKGGAAPNRNYKDSVFVDIFSRDEITRREGAISLYNALHKEKVPEDAEVKFLELKNVVYHKVKNDVSFLLNGRIIVLFEHQSTINQNMAFRMLLYIAALYELITDVEKRYCQKLVKIQSPEFYVIYNGAKPYPALSKLRLSKAFMQKRDELSLELVVKVININHPDSKDILERCELLKGYQEFEVVVSRFKSLYGDAGYDLAIEYCIEHNILPNYLARNIREVRNMLQVEYSYETEMKVLREEALEEARKKAKKMWLKKGMERGIEKGIEQGRAEGKAEGRAEGKAEGRAEGIRAHAIETAKKLLDMGLSISAVAEATSLGEAEIAKL